VSSIDWYSPAEILEEAKLGTLQIAPPQFLDLLRIGRYIIGVAGYRSPHSKYFGTLLSS